MRGFNDHPRLGVAWGGRPRKGWLGWLREGSRGLLETLHLSQYYMVTGRGLASFRRGGPEGRYIAGTAKAVWSVQKEKQSLVAKKSQGEQKRTAKNGDAYRNENNRRTSDTRAGPENDTRKH